MTVKEIIEKYPYLTEDDFGYYSDEGKEYVILEESGRQKLIEEEGITYDTNCQHYHPDGHAVVHCGAFIPERTELIPILDTIGERIIDGKQVTALGSVNPRTSSYPFFVEVAEKRAIDRAVRKLTGLGANVYGRNEIHKAFSVQVDEEEVNITPEGQQEVLKHIQKLDKRRDAPTKGKEATNKKQSK